MRQLLVMAWLTVGLLGVAGGAQGAAAPQDGPKKVKLTTRDHKEISYDLAKPEHRAQIKKHIDAGEVEKIVAEKEVNLMELRWDTALWSIVVFLLLFLILKKMAWGPMLEGLQKREENIQAALVEAKEAREEARKLKDELQAQRNKAAQEVAEAIAEARRDAENLRNDMMAKAKAEIQTERDRLLREISTAKDQALQEIWQRAADLATTISSKAVKKTLSVDDHRRLVDEAIADMPIANEDRKRLQGV
jgi:F-type H+-transporting ATPase subunit b